MRDDLDLSLIYLMTFGDIPFSIGLTEARYFVFELKLGDLLENYSYITEWSNIDTLPVVGYS